jgi:hypothetical protein
MKGTFHGSRADQSPTGSHGANPVSVCKDLQQGDWIINAFQVGVTVELGTESFPNIPGGSNGVLSGMSNAIGCHFFDSIEFSTDTMLCSTGASCQQGWAG